MSAWCCLSKWTCWTHASDTAPATLQCCDPDVKIIKNYTPYRWQRRFLPFRCHHPVNLIVTYARKLLAFAQNSDWMNFDVAFSFFFRQKYQKACDHGINEKLEGTAYTADYALARGLGETEWFIPGALLSDSGLLGMFFFWFQLTVIQTWTGENGSIFSWFMQLNILESPVFLDDKMFQEGVK